MFTFAQMAGSVLVESMLLVFCLLECNAFFVWLPLCSGSLQDYESRMVDGEKLVSLWNNLMTILYVFP